MNEAEELKREIELLKGEVSYLRSSFSEQVNMFEKHTHNGRDAKQITSEDLLQHINAVGSVTMATDGRIYKIGIPTGCKNIAFNGVAFHYDGGAWGVGSRDARAILVGNAHLGKGYNLQPDTNSSVVVGGLLQNIIQSSTNQVVVGSTLTSNVSEYYLASILYPTGSSNPVRLEIIEYGLDSIQVEATLSAGWGVIANFVIT